MKNLDLISILLIITFFDLIFQGIIENERISLTLLRLAIIKIVAIITLIFMQIF